MITTVQGNGFVIVHEDSPPRILLRDLSGKINGYIDLKTGMQISKTATQLQAMGVSPKLLEDTEAEKL